jgi:crossover junction endodeoxyribonuclease RusA
MVFLNQRITLLELTIPFPPSVNRVYRNLRGRTLISREGRAYRKDVCALLAGGGCRQPPLGGRIALSMDAFPPDKRRRDLDNLQKSLIDALQHAGVYEDDSQIDLLVTRRRELVKGGRLLVRVHSFPLSRCPVCGGSMNPENN